MNGIRLSAAEAFWRKLVTSKGWKVFCTLLAASVAFVAPLFLSHYVFPAAQSITGQHILYDRTRFVCTLVISVLDCLAAFGLLWVLRVRHRTWFYIVSTLLIFLWVVFYVVIATGIVLDSGDGW